MTATATTPREEERAALERHRNLQRAQRAAATQRERDYARRVREAAADTRAAHPRCSCDFRGVRSREELVSMGAGCTAYYVCPRLDAVRRRLGI